MVHTGHVGCPQMQATGVEDVPRRLGGAVVVNTQLFQEYKSRGAGDGAALEAGELLEEMAWVVAGEEAPW